LTSGDSPGPLVQYWHQQPVPDHVAETLASFRENNPDMEQLVFDESSAEAFIAERYGPREAAAFSACAVPAMQADYFRYCAIHALGGVYADANFLCLQSLRSMIDRSKQGALFGRQDPVPKALAALYNWRYPVGPFRVITNSMFGFRDGGHPLLGLAVRASTANIENRVADGPTGVWVTTGPGVFTSIYLLNELGSLDAFIEYAAGGVLEPSASLFCEVVGDHAKIDRIWDGIGIWPLEHRKTWGIKPPRRHEPSGHWGRLEGSIYR
jgi:Glycosyltransferase sugar-binding region containing DXD motif